MCPANLTPKEIESIMCAKHNNQEPNWLNSICQHPAFSFLSVHIWYHETSKK